MGATMADDFEREMEEARRAFKAKGSMPGGKPVQAGQVRDKRSLKQRLKDHDEDREAQAWKDGREEDYRMYMLKYARIQTQLIRNLLWATVLVGALIIFVLQAT